jgi:flagellar hook-associated protein 3 FlgL
MSTGKRILTPSDDPVAAAQALVVSQQQSVNSQFLANQGNAASQLTSLESNLRNASDLVSSVIDQAVEAGNDALDDNGRKDIAANIRGNFNQLLGLANATDSLGQYIFSGFRGDTQPFAVSGSPGNRTTAYQGDGGSRQLQVDTGRVMDVSASGSDVFMRIPQGNGEFTFSAAAANSGTGVIGASSTITGYDNSTYQLTFTAPGVYTLDVTTNGVTTSTPGLAYTDGADIVLGSGSQHFKISLSGTPAAGDVFTVSPSSNQDVFKTLDSMIKALESNVSSNATTKATFKNQMAVIRQNLNQAFNHLITAQTSVGARQLELDNLTNAGKDRDLQYQTNLNTLQNIDMIQAASDMANQKMVLEAAQLSFKQVSQMSLFNYL